MTQEQKKWVRKEIFGYMRAWYQEEMKLLDMTDPDGIEVTAEWVGNFEGHARGLVDGIWLADRKFSYRMLCFVNNLKWHWQQVINREYRKRTAA